MTGVAVLGCGIVGSGVVRMLTENQNMVCESAGGPVRLTHVVDVREIDLPSGVNFSTNLDTALADEEVRVVVEAIGGTKVAYEYTKQALTSGRHVVTSNKALVAEHGDELLNIAREHSVRYMFEAAVGGGVPILRPMQTCLSGNRLTCVEGIVNGSTNYLLTSMEETNSTYPEALKEAQKLGYVEGNPDADIEGWDARRKLAILAHAAFGAPLSGDEHIPTQGIGRVTEGDIAIARALQMRIKLIAHGELREDHWTGWVAPMLVSKEHPFYRVDGVRNAICVHGNFVGDVVFEGQGAGSRPTASAVVGDVIDIVRRGPGENAPLIPSAVPTFALDEELMIRRAVRMEGQISGEVMKAAEQSVPGTVARMVEGIPFFMTTREMPLDKWNLAVKRLSALDIKMGPVFGLL